MQTRGDLTRGRSEWRGSLFLWNDRSFYIGAAADSVVHSTHDVTICIALDGSFRVRTDAGWHDSQAAIIPSDVPHVFDGRGAQLMLLYFSPESLRPERLIYPSRQPHALSSNLAARFLPPLRKYLAHGCSPDEATELCDDFVGELIRADHRRLPLDQRVAHALECFHADPIRRFTAAEISSTAALSPSRFAHLFREQIGLPVRHYLLELRLRRALLQVANGDSLTTSAHEAGFSDSAHFSRTFRRMTGIAPSSVLKHSRVIHSQR